MRKFCISYIEGEGYSLEYEPEQNKIIPVIEKLDGVAAAVLAAKRYMREHGMKCAELYEPWGVIWRIEGSIAKRIACPYS